MVETVMGEAAKLLDLLERAQEEARAARAERDRFKERLAQVEREPTLLAREVARLKRNLATWQAAAFFLLILTALLFVMRR